MRTLTADNPSIYPPLDGAGVRHRLHPARRESIPVVMAYEIASLRARPSYSNNQRYAAAAGQWRSLRQSLSLSFPPSFNLSPVFLPFLSTNTDVSTMMACLSKREMLNGTVYGLSS